MKIPKRIAQALMNSLKGGVVPRVGLNYVTVGRTAERQVAFAEHLLLHAADPPVENQTQRSALRLCLGGHIADKLLVGGKSLPPGALQPPLRGEVGIHHHKILRHYIIADGLQQEALAAAILALSAFLYSCSKETSSYPS